MTAEDKDILVDSKDAIKIVLRIHQLLVDDYAALLANVATDREALYAYKLKIDGARELIEGMKRKLAFITKDVK